MLTNKTNLHMAHYRWDFITVQERYKMIPIFSHKHTHNCATTIVFSPSLMLDRHTTSKNDTEFYASIFQLSLVFVKDI